MSKSFRIEAYRNRMGHFSDEAPTVLHPNVESYHAACMTVRRNRVAWAKDWSIIHVVDNGNGLIVHRTALRPPNRAS